MCLLVSYMCLLFSHSHAFCSNTLQIFANIHILRSVPQLVQFMSVCVHGKTNSLHVLGILNDFAGNNNCPIIITTNLQHLYININYPIIFALFFLIWYTTSVLTIFMNHLQVYMYHCNLYVLLFFHQFVYLCSSTITPWDLFYHQNILGWHVSVLTVDPWTLWSLHDSH